MARTTGDENHSALEEAEVRNWHHHVDLLEPTQVGSQKIAPGPAMSVAR